ncbi:MAG TPA: hypothetical protein VK190_02580 [Pseudoneobacillus sp.]|nr:hypothetical protein [Pseudoneobacillus sp.]
MDKLAMYMAIGTIPGITFESIPKEHAPHYMDGGIVYSNKNIDKDIKIVVRIDNDRVLIQYGYKRYGNSIWIIPYISEYSYAYNSFRNIGSSLTFQYPNVMQPLELLETWLKMQTLLYADWFNYIKIEADKVRSEIADKGKLRYEDKFHNNRIAALRIKTMDNNPGETFLYRIEIGYKPGQLLLTSLYAYDKATDIFHEVAPNGSGSFNRDKIFSVKDKHYCINEEFKPLKILYKDIFKEVDKND